jgi:hypothetical protein
MSDYEDPPAAAASVHALLAAAAAASCVPIVDGFLRGGAGGGGLMVIAGIATFFAGIIIAALHLALLGLPLYLVLRRFYRVGLGSCAAAGLVIGAIPMPLLFGFWEDGSLGGVAVFAVPGPAAGLAFGLTLVRHERRLSLREQEGIFG